MRKEYANEVLSASKAGYEIIAEDFSRTRGKFWKELLFVRDMIPKGARLLDVGCGNGRFLGSPLDESIDYTGIDFSEGLISVARERYDSRAHTTFVAGDALTLPFPDHSFDIVVSFAVLHHIPSRAYRVEFLREVARAVKPGGLIIITAWNVWRAKPRIILKYAFKKICGLASLDFVLKNFCGLSRLDFGDAFLGFGKEKNARFVHALSKRELFSLAREAGLTVEKFDIIRRPFGEENFFMIMRS
ncbi:MAG: methyltransferase domain-containing protein [Patescibacteria group bacterium]